MILRELREIDHATDDILIYGYDGADNQKLKTDTAGRLDIVSDNLDVSLSDLKTLLQSIDGNTDELEDKVQSVRDQLNVVLSTRASESTALEILDALGVGSGTDLLTQLQTLNDKDFATESTLIEVRDYLDTVETKLQTIIDRLDTLISTDFATEATQAEILDTIGQESGATVLSKLDQIDNTLIDLITPFPGISIRRFYENAGSPDCNVDGSSTPVEFTVTPSTGKIFYVHSLSVALEDNAINFSKFAGIAPLTNGVDFNVQQIGLSEITIENIKVNSEFYTFANDVILDSATIDILVAHINIKQDTGTTIKLVDSLNDNLKVIINDDLTSITKFQVLVRGYEVDE